MTRYLSCFYTLLLLATPGAAFAQNGIVAWYTFENGFADGSGNNLDGIPRGGATIVYDSALKSHVVRLNGSSACVDLGNSTLFDWGGAFSAAFWIRVNEWHNSQDAILEKINAWTFERNFETQWISYYSWPEFVPTSASLPSDSTWHHVAATYDGVTQKLYIDGVVKASAPKLGSIAVNSNHVFIGSAGGTTRFFDGCLDDIRVYNRILTPSEIESLAVVRRPFVGKFGPVMQIEGDYEMHVQVTQGLKSGPLRVFFSGNSDTTVYAFAEIVADTLRIGRYWAGATKIWKVSTGVGNPPWNIRILKKGSNYRFWVNGATAWIRGPLGEWESIYEPWKALVGVITPDSGMVQSFTVTLLPWLQQITSPVISLGPPGSFYEAQVIPGAIIRFGGLYYMYFMGAMNGNQEGAAGRKIGVASSPDLRVWTVQPQPILSYEQLRGQGDNLYPSGAVVTPDGKIALMYAVQLYPTWKGFNLATATDPLGPFQNYAGNPVYMFSNTAHEFDLVRTDDSLHRYIVLFAGFTTNPPSGPVGDRGYAIYSNDLVHWQADARNPVFGPSTLDNWDAVHVRPRSLNKIGDIWYLWYEGTNTWTTPNPSYGVWWDGIGLARSQDLVHWEYYPRNPALPALGLSASQFDNDWVGWPRMIIQGDTGYVSYTGGAQTGMRTIAIAQLTDWTSEGGTVTGIHQGVPQKTANVPRQYLLEQNFPNPFNPTTTIRYALPQRSYVTLSVFNTLGQKVATLVDADQDAGYHELRFDSTRLASGVYFYQLRAGTFIETKKFLVVR